MTRVCGVHLVLILVLFGTFMPAASAYSAPAEALFAEGVNLIEARNYTGAIQAFDAAIALEPGYYEAWNAKADALNRNGNYSQALESSDRCLALNSTFLQGWINRGYILYNLGRYSEERAAYDQAIAIDPGNATAWFNRGYALAAQGNYDEALESFDRVKTLDPEYPYLEGNRETVEKYRNAATPFYVRYASWILVFAGAVLVVGVWIYSLKKKRR